MSSPGLTTISGSPFKGPESHLAQMPRDRFEMREIEVFAQRY